MFLSSCKTVSWLGACHSNQGFYQYSVPFYQCFECSWIWAWTVWWWPGCPAWTGVCTEWSPHRMLRSSAPGHSAYSARCRHTRPRHRHSALSRSQTKAGAFQNYTVEYVTVSLEYSHGISVIQTLQAGCWFVAQCAALSNYPGSLVTSPGARISPASSARPGAGGEYTYV